MGAFVLVLALLLTSCSNLSDLVAGALRDDQVEEPGPDAEADDGAPTAEDQDEPPADPAATGTAQALQDLWMFTRIQAIEADGSTRDVVVDVLADLETRAGDPVELADGIVFREVADLRPTMVRADGSQRTDVDVVAGLFELTGGPSEGIIDDGVGKTLGVVGSAGIDVVHIAPGDLLTLDLFDLDPLANVETALVDYAFAQTLPPDGDQQETRTDDPVALLAERFAAGRVVYGTPDEGGDDVAIFSGVPLQRTDAPGGTDVVQSSFGSAIDGMASVSMRTADEEPSLLLAQGTGSGTGMIPVKARGPIAGAVVSALVCLGVAILAGPAGGVVVTVVCTAMGVLGIAGTIGALLDDNNDSDPDPRPCVGKCTRSWGDPHLVGFTGLTYDVHAVGEFTAVQSGGLDVQVRTIPVGAYLAANGAIAAQVADHRITIEPGRDQVLWVDGQPADLDEFERRDLDGGGSLARYGAAFDLSWPDGSQLWVDTRNGILDYELAMGSDDVEVVGLHGALDGQRLFPDGTVLEDDADHESLYAFVDAWRITDATSLFDYPEGASTSTYTDWSYPPGPVDPEDLDAAARAWAETVCRAAGLDGETLQGCIIDVAASGDTTFVWGALEHQAIVDPDAFETTYDALERADGSDDVLVLDDGLSIGEIAWSMDARKLAAQFEGEVFELSCPGLPAEDVPLGFSFPLWGTDIYSDDSGICAAAVHAGLFRPEIGGDVRLALWPGQAEYEGSERNGASSRDWSSWGGSYIFLDPAGRKITGR